MSEILLPEHLRAAGLGPNEWTRMADHKELIRIRRGAYVVPGLVPQSSAGRHRQMIVASLPYLSEASVVSHASAAVLHGLPFWDSELSQVHVTRDRDYGGKDASLLHLYSAAFHPGDVTVVDGIPVTSLPRTVIDCARRYSLKRGVAVADAALALGLVAEELQAVAQTSRRRPGMVRARRVIRLADGRSESVGESFSRVTWIDLGLAPSHLQYDVRDRAGKLVGRSDFCWEAQGVLGEFDGRIKYGALVRPGQDATDVLFAEKKREDALRDLGWEIVRWIWEDLQHPEQLAERLERAFARSGASAPLPGPAGAAGLRPRRLPTSQAAFLLAAPIGRARCDYTLRRRRWVSRGRSRPAGIP